MTFVLSAQRCSINVVVVFTPVFFTLIACESDFRCHEIVHIRLTSNDEDQRWCKQSYGAGSRNWVRAVLCYQDLV